MKPSQKLKDMLRNQLKILEMELKSLSRNHSRKFYMVWGLDMLESLLQKQF